MDVEDRVMFGVMFTVCLVVFLLFAFPIGSIFMGFNVNPGKGEKVGYVIRMTEEGIVCKTLEAQLIRGGLQDGSGAFGVVPFEFTVPVDDRMFARRVTEAMDSQTEVIINYDIDGLYSTCNSGSGGHYLTDIKPRR